MTKRLPLQQDRKRGGKWKPHEFSDFLTRTGVTAALAEAVLALCQADDIPADPIEFIRLRMKADNVDTAEIRACRQKIAESNAKADGLRARREWLLESKRRIEMAYDCGDGDGDGAEES